MIFDTIVSFAESPCPSEPSGSPSPPPSYESLRPSVHLSDGTVLKADMIIGADGQHSTVRLSVQEEDVKPKSTGTVVLTGNIPIREILEDDVLKTQSVAYSWVYWFGPRRCFMGVLLLLMGYNVSFTTFQAIQLWVLERSRKCSNKTDFYRSPSTRNTQYTYFGIMKNLTCQKAGYPMCRPNLRSWLT
jgi:hypothetical protein